MKKENGDKRETSLLSLPSLFDEIVSDEVLPVVEEELLALLDLLLGVDPDPVDKPSSTSKYYNNIKG